MKFNRVKTLLMAAAVSLGRAVQYANLRACRPARRSPGVQSLVCASTRVALIGIIVLVAVPTSRLSRAQPRAAHPVRPAARRVVARHGRAPARVVYIRCCTRVARAPSLHAAVRRPVHPRVRPVYVVVRPVYPAVTAWYSSYPYQYYPYQYYPYQYGLYDTYGYYTYNRYPFYSGAAYQQQGYSDGFRRGQDDAEDHRIYDPYRHRHYRKSGSLAYSNGFLNGYAAGYGQ